MRAFNRQFTACSVQQDRVIRKLPRNFHCHPRVDPSYRPFGVRGVAAIIRKAGSSTAQVPDGPTMIHLRHLGPHGLAFLVELFNLSVSGINIPVIWKNSVIIPILKAGKPREQGRSYRPISLLCPAVKILERLILASIVEALDTCPSQYGFKPRHSTPSALLPISARVVFGFNQRKPHSRTIAIVVRWLVAYLRGRKASCLYQQHHSPSRELREDVPQGSVIVPALFNPFVPDCPIPDLKMTSYTDDFTLLASAPSIVESEMRANQLCSTLVRLADGKQLAIANRNLAWPCSHPIPTSTDSSLKCESATQWLRWTEHLKSRVSRWTPT